jgi:hypothetical protein
MWRLFNSSGVFGWTKEGIKYINSWKEYIFRRRVISLKFQERSSQGKLENSYNTTLNTSGIGNVAQV